MLKNNKKGLATGLIALMLVLFVMALSNLAALYMWNTTNAQLQNMSNDSISQDVKDKIDDKVTPFMSWGDKLFVILFIILLLGYIITSVTLPVDRPIFLFVFFFILIFITIIAMIISNSWAYLIENPNLVSAASSLKFTDWFMKYLPMIVFFTGIVGGILFYGRKQKSFEGGGNISGFE
jgi:hypothetical protein